jgi:hypothetical protein
MGEKFECPSMDGKLVYPHNGILVSILKEVGGTQKDFKNIFLNDNLKIIL